MRGGLKDRIDAENLAKAVEIMAQKQGMPVTAQK